LSVLPIYVEKKRKKGSTDDEERDFFPTSSPRNGDGKPCRKRDDKTLAPDPAANNAARTSHFTLVSSVTEQCTRRVVDRSVTSVGGNRNVTDVGGGSPAFCYSIRSTTRVDRRAPRIVLRRRNRIVQSARPVNARESRQKPNVHVENSTFSNRVRVPLKWVWKKNKTFLTEIYVLEGEKNKTAGRTEPTPNYYFPEQSNVSGSRRSKNILYRAVRSSVRKPLFSKHIPDTTDTRRQWPIHVCFIEYATRITRCCGTFRTPYRKRTIDCFLHTTTVRVFSFFVFWMSSVNTFSRSARTICVRSVTFYSKRFPISSQ